MVPAGTCSNSRGEHRYDLLGDLCKGAGRADLHNRNAGTGEGTTCSLRGFPCIAEPRFQLLLLPVMRSGTISSPSLANDICRPIAQVGGGLQHWG